MPPTLTSLGPRPIGIVFTGREPVDANRPLTVAFTNVQGTANEHADVVPTYGTRTETFRKITLDAPARR